jgi:hypothetical protein
MNPKKITSVLAITLLLTSLIATLVPGNAASTLNEYTLVNGVLTTDEYDFYPYDNKSVDFGFSKYGELIFWNESDPLAWWGVGLQYPGYDSVGTYVQPNGPSWDPFANEQVTPTLWLNGWFCEIRYTHTGYGDRRLLAMAMFADLGGLGGEWINGFDLSFPRNMGSSPNGGRKTTGYAETEDVKVLYDGPRKYIAQTTTHLYDWVDLDLEGDVDHPSETIALLDVKLTYIFNKVKKTGNYIKRY